MASLITQKKRARSLAVQCLYSWVVSGNSMNDVMDYVLEQEKRQYDKEYATSILLGIEKDNLSLETVITPYLDRSLKSVDPVEISIVKLATYELLNCLDLPYKVIINEAVENAKRFGATESHKFVNAILDKIASEHRKHN